MTEERITNPLAAFDDAKSDAVLRPKRLDEFVGQDELKSNLRVFVEAARHLGGRMLTEAGPTNRERIIYGCRLCLSRPPTEPELNVFSEIVDKRTAQYRADSEAASEGG